MATNQTAKTLTISAAGGTPAAGGGGGGNVIIESAGACEFSLVKLTNGFINARCPRGRRDRELSDYQVSLDNVECEIDESTFMIAGKSQHSFTVSKCQCPTNETIQESVQITNAACTVEAPVQFYSNALARFFATLNSCTEDSFAVLIISVAALGLTIAVKYL